MQLLIKLNKQTSEESKNKTGTDIPPKGVYDKETITLINARIETIQSDLKDHINNTDKLTTILRNNIQDKISVPDLEEFNLKM